MPSDETASPSIGRWLAGRVVTKRSAYAAVASAVARFLSIMMFGWSSFRAAAQINEFTVQKIVTLAMLSGLRHWRERADRGLVQHLNHVAVGIAEIERNRAVAMVGERAGDRERMA